MKDIQELLQTVYRLRAPGGCPWDRKQTFQSLRPFFLEETYEALEALDKIDSPEKLKDPALKTAFVEELGDVLLQILLHSEIANETGDFDFNQVCAFLNEKLIRRHPHVFGDASADSAESAYQNWERIKAQEKGAKNSVLDGLPPALPALARTTRVIDKVTRVGFQWPDLKGPIAKLEEEVRELKEVALQLEAQPDNTDLQKKVESELGDVLFCAANLGFTVKVNPEDALRSMLVRFEKRFRYVEKQILAGGKKLEESTLEEMDKHWDIAKKLEREGKLD